MRCACDREEWNSMRFSCVCCVLAAVVGCYCWQQCLWSLFVVIVFSFMNIAAVSVVVILVETYTINVQNSY